MSRVFILALDGLEHDFVLEWNLRSLLQQSYGKIAVSQEYFKTHKEGGNPYTPIIWTSFITGLKPEHHGMEDLWTYGKVLDFVRNLPVVRWLKGKRRITMKLLKPRPIRYDGETIFDKVSESIALDVPCYSVEAEDQIRLAEAFLNEGIGACRKGMYQLFERRKRKLFSVIDENWRLLMAYFQIADLVGHICMPWRLHELRKVYRKLNEMSYALENKLRDTDTVLLIVSDHGISDDGMHSHHAFWSLNYKTDWHPNDFVDYYPKILEWTKTHRGIFNG